MISYPEIEAVLPIGEEDNSVTGFHTEKIELFKSELDNFKKIRKIEIVFQNESTLEMKYENNKLIVNGNEINDENGIFTIGKNIYNDNNIKKFIIKGEKYNGKNENDLIKFYGYSDHEPGTVDSLVVNTRNYLLDPDIEENKDINYIYNNTEDGINNVAKLYFDTIIKSSYYSDKTNKNVYAFPKEDERFGVRDAKNISESYYTLYKILYWNNKEKKEYPENPELEIGYKSIGTYTVDFRQYLNTGKNLPRLYDEKFSSFDIRNKYTRQETDNDGIKDFSLNTAMTVDLRTTLPTDNFDAYYVVLDKKIIPYVNFIEITKKDGTKTKINK